MDAVGQRNLFERRAHRAEHPFGVIATGRRFNHGRATLRPEARQEHAGFHLGARDGTFVGDPVQRSAHDAQGRTLAFDGRAHKAQGLGDPGHWTA